MVMNFYSAHHNEYEADGILNIISHRQSFKTVHDKFISMLSGKWGLDVGCGPGMYWSKYYTDKGFIMKSMDSNDVVVQNLENCIKYTAPDEFPLDDNEFDFAICSCMVQHLNSWNEVKLLLDEIDRVVYPGGNLLFVFKEGTHDTEITLHDNVFNVERKFRVYDSQKVVQYINKQWNIMNIISGTDIKRVTHYFILARHRPKMD